MPSSDKLYWEVLLGCADTNPNLPVLNPRPYPPILLRMGSLLLFPLNDPIERCDQDQYDPQLHAHLQVSIPITTSAHSHHSVAITSVKVSSTTSGLLP